MSILRPFVITNRDWMRFVQLSKYSSTGIPVFIMVGSLKFELHTLLHSAQIEGRCALQNAHISCYQYFISSVARAAVCARAPHKEKPAG